AAVEMISPHHYRRFQLAARDQFVEREAEFVSLAVAQPANPRWQPLKLHAFLRQLDPARQVLVLRKHFEDELVRTRDVRSFAGKCCPAERPFAFAKKRPDINRDKSRKVVGVLDAVLECKRSN